MTLTLVIGANVRSTWQMETIRGWDYATDNGHWYWQQGDGINPSSIVPMFDSRDVCC